MLYLEDSRSLLNSGITRLLQLKDVDIRLLSLYQCRHAVDASIHIGGAFSATIPMVCLFYGGIIRANVEQPAAPGQDLFILSKGHAVATLASIYADLGYFDKAVLRNSRSITSILNGHPGPLLPGVHVATGPMGQGMGVAQGFAIAGQGAPSFDVYALTGDGELQEGPIWESVMYAGYKRLENLCVMVDNNNGQLDNTSMLHFPYNSLSGSFTSFGWRVLEVDATRHHTVYQALQEFRYGQRDGRPTVIICKSTKGQGGFSDHMNSHKTSIDEATLDQESTLQTSLRATREAEFCIFFNALSSSGVHNSPATASEHRTPATTPAHSVQAPSSAHASWTNSPQHRLPVPSPDHQAVADLLREHAVQMGFFIHEEKGVAIKVTALEHSVRTKKAPIREKKITYTAAALPKLETGKPYAAHKIIESAMKVFAKDPRIVSVDADLASTSGLQSGVGFVDKTRALNVGVAEANMMLIGEAFAILGANAWVSTFCPFYDWKVLRRIAVGHQERLEVIAAKGWLSDGHGLDLTMLATAADLETQSNGATHMGNDDALLFNEVAHVRIINVSCPQQLLAVLKWIMEGNKGIIYLRVLRAPATAIYSSDFVFEFGKGYVVKGTPDTRAHIVTSGRGVYETIEAANVLETKGIPVNVIDMPSIDGDMIVELGRSGRPVFFVEQNNGFIWSNARRILFSREETIDTRRFIPINTTHSEGLHYIHSGTYAELAAGYGLNASGLVEKIAKHFNITTSKMKAI